MQLFGTFYLFGCIVLVAMPVVYCILPETKDISLESIQKYFTKDSDSDVIQKYWVEIKISLFLKTDFLTFAVKYDDKIHCFHGNFHSGDQIVGPFDSEF